jgi:hypothetical protein
MTRCGFDMDRDRVVDERSPSPERHATQSQPQRAVGIVSDAPTEAPLEVTQTHTPS